MLIFAHTSSPRLQYICKFIFTEQLNCAYSLTTHAESFQNHVGPKINYSNTAFNDESLQLIPHPLLFEANITTQETACFELNAQKVFFKSGPDYGFDIFAASFYLISRYEEYLPHKKDMYGRFAHEHSLAFKENFLNTPLVNNWIMEFAMHLQRRFASFTYHLNKYSFIPTYDIDIAWSYKNKGLIRNLGGLIKKPSLSRVISLAGLIKDPYDSYAFMDELHERHALKPVYFFLLAEKNGLYDRNILPSSRALRELISSHSEKYETGIHPSWASYERPALIKREKELLQEISGKAVTKSRQHYIKMELPDTYYLLLDAGITEDYSMGYGTINGFRASVASAFYWYDLVNEKASKLLLYPFCFMDANSHYEQKYSAAQAYEEILNYFKLCKNASGIFISIFHNNFLGTAKDFAGWKEMYDSFITQARQ